MTEEKNINLPLKRKLIHSEYLVYRNLVRRGIFSTLVRYGAATALKNDVDNEALPLKYYFYCQTSNFASSFPFYRYSSSQILHYSRLLV